MIWNKIICGFFLVIDFAQTLNTIERVAGNIWNAHLGGLCDPT